MNKNISIEIPEYNHEQGFKFKWCDDFEIYTEIDNNEITIRANREGLISLANHLLNLAQKEVPTPYHFHLDDYGAFEKGSSPMIIEKIK